MTEANSYGNGSLKKIITGGVLTAIIVSIILMVLSNASRITAVEVETRTVKEMLKDYRIENREEHTRIMDKLDSVAKELRRQSDNIK